MPRSCLVAALHPQLLRSLKRTLEPEFEVVGMPDNSISLQDSLHALEPDVAVVDLGVLGDAPWKLVALLRQRFPALRLIVLTHDHDPAELELVLEAGADEVVERSRIVSTLISAAKQGLAS